MAGENRLDPALQKAVHLLRRAPHVQLGAQLLLQLGAGDAEGRVGGDPVQQVVLQPLLLDLHF